MRHSALIRHAFFFKSMLKVCYREFRKHEDTVASKETQQANMQLDQYSKAQFVPTFDVSLERHLLIELYKIRNKNIATHVVWRSNAGTIEDDCPAMGYGIHDTSLINPPTGMIDPIYTESRVTIYPYPIGVNYTIVSILAKHP